MKNVLITGCGSGLGESLVKQSTKYPVNVFPHYRDKQDKEFTGDITDAKFLEDVSNYLDNNKIDVFINNAAVYSHGNLIDINDDEIINVIHTNLISQILILKRVYKFFNEKKSGLIVNINSLAGLYPSPKESVYSASKFGLYGFSKSLQLEVIDSKIEIIDVFPGAMKTRMTSHRQNYDSLMNPDEVAETIYDMIFKNHIVNELVIRRKKN